MFALKGVAGYLFVPMAEAVVFAMIASFVLSRTLVPTMAMYLLKPHAHAGAGLGEDGEEPHAGRPPANPLVRFQRGFEAGFERFRESYRNLLALALAHRRAFVIGFMAVVVVSFGLGLFLGSNFFPSVDSGQMTLHMRPRVGLRIEDASAMFGEMSSSGFARPFRRTSWARSSTTSACRPAASTPSTTTPASSVSRTAISSSA